MLWSPNTVFFVINSRGLISTKCSSFPSPFRIRSLPLGICKLTSVPGKSVPASSQEASLQPLISPGLNKSLLWSFLFVIYVVNRTLLRALDRKDSSSLSTRAPSGLLMSEASTPQLILKTSTHTSPPPSTSKN